MYIMTKLKTHQLQTNYQKLHSTLAHHMVNVNNDKKNKNSSGKLIEKSDTSLVSWQRLLVNDFHTYTCALYVYQFQQITQALILPNGNYPSSFTGPAQISMMLVRATVLPSSCPSGAPELAQGQNRDGEREREEVAELSSEWFMNSYSVSVAVAGDWPKGSGFWRGSQLGLCYPLVC